MDQYYSYQCTLNHGLTLSPRASTDNPWFKTVTQGKAARTPSSISAWTAAAPDSDPSSEHLYRYLSATQTNGGSAAEPAPPKQQSAPPKQQPSPPVQHAPPKQQPSPPKHQSAPAKPNNTAAQTAPVTPKAEPRGAVTQSPEDKKREILEKATKRGEELARQRIPREKPSRSLSSSTGSPEATVGFADRKKVILDRAAQRGKAAVEQAARSVQVPATSAPSSTASQNAPPRTASQSAVQEDQNSTASVRMVEERQEVPVASVRMVEERQEVPVASVRMVEERQEVPVAAAEGSQGRDAAEVQHAVATSDNGQQNCDDGSNSWGIFSSPRVIIGATVVVAIGVVGVMGLRKRFR